MYTVMCVSWEARRGCLVPIEPELQMAVSHEIWLLGNEPRSSARVDYRWLGHLSSPEF